MEFIRNIDDLNIKDVNIAGGKAASLGEIHKIGVLVPPGFVILTNTFEQFLISRKIPKNIEREIIKNFSKLNTEYVAVRSSATVEDGKNHSWAGQLESYLNVNKNHVLEKAKDCMASLFTPRAIFYRSEKGLDKTNISVAVIVQKMIKAKFSGIAFSVHPVTQNYNQLIIEASFGLGDKVVSGLVTPDSYIVEKDSRKITKNGGILNEKQILELSEIILKIEKHFCFPCDIEWAYEEGKFYILQSRPITTLTQNYPISWQGQKLNWVKFLERKRTPFIYFPFIEIETNRIKNICGFRFYHHLYKWSEDTGIHFRVSEELLKCDEHFISLINNKDPRIEIWYKKALAMHSLADKWLTDFKEKPKPFSVEIFDLFYEDFINILLYTATIPYLVLSSINTELTKNATREDFAEILKIYEPIRGISKYPELERIILNNWFEELGKKYGVDPAIIHFLTPDEIRGLGKDGIDKESLIKRKKQSLFWNNISDNKLTFSFDNSLEKEIPALVEEIGSSKILRGDTAFPGYAKGVVRIINKKEDIKNFDQGDILVSLNTNSDFVPIIKKAGAIITDDGTAASHAAILMKIYAHQFKIPCITGTKIATKVLKDGDMIEVNATKAIVRVL